MSRQTQSYDDKAIRGEELESLATSIAQKIVDNGQVVAEALDELDARTRALENRNPDVLGDAVADSLDAQVLKIGGQPIDTSSYEQVANKVSTWQGTPDNTHYPSEKLVKDGLDAKADADSHVAIADSIISRTGQSGNGWYKVAERQFNSLADNINAIFDVFASTTEIKLAGELSFRIRSGSSSGGNISLKNYRLFSDDWTSDFKFKIVSRGLAGSCIIELWASCLTSYSGLGIAERNSSSYSSARRKGNWTYSNYINNGGSSAPVTDAGNNVTVTDVDIVYRQHNIDSPTNNNLVAMDANGLVKDSGLAKSSVESAISSAGSAIQGVKVNNTTLTPDANKVVTVPLATTSADGAMSAADKTKLEGKVTGPSSATEDDIAVFDGTTGKLVKDGGKKISDLALNNSVISYCDAKAGNGTVAWYKMCERNLTNTSARLSCSWLVTISDASDSLNIVTFILDVSIAFGASGTTPVILKNISSPINSDNNVTRLNNSIFRVVVTGTSGAATISLYFKQGGSSMYMILREIAGGITNQATTKGNWSYISYASANPGESTAPEGNVYKDIEWCFVKELQTAVTDPTASGTALSFIDSITQNANGEVTVTKKTVQDASSSQKGVVKLYDVRGINTDGTMSQYSESLYFGSSSYYTRGTAKYVKLFTITMSGDSRLSGCKFSATTRDNGDINTSMLIDLYFGKTPSDNTLSGNVIVTSALRYNVGYGPSPSFGIVREGDTTFGLWALMRSWASLNITPMQFAGTIARSTTTSDTEPEGWTDVTRKVLVSMPSIASVGNESVPVYADASGAVTPCTDDFVHDGDVVSTYSSTGTAPVNGTAVAAALATSLTDVAYAANASGGGGDLNKTKNGSTTSVLAFMSDAEAIDLWRTAWDEAD